MWLGGGGEKYMNVQQQQYTAWRFVVLLFYTVVRGLTWFSSSCMSWLCMCYIYFFVYIYRYMRDSSTVISVLVYAGHGGVFVPNIRRLSMIGFSFPSGKNKQSPHCSNPSSRVLGREEEEEEISPMRIFFTHSPTHSQTAPKLAKNNLGSLG